MVFQARVILLLLNDWLGSKEDMAGRPLPMKPYSGAVSTHELNEEEEREWKKWKPNVGDVVLVDLPDEGIWPGKVCRNLDTWTQ